ncbi:hypothetical protein [Planococcus antarcticus]|nr:hypothetical protein [Planococcus antarcticus]
MSGILFCASPKVKKASDIVKKLNLQGINAELCKKVANLQENY